VVDVADGAQALTVFAARRAEVRLVLLDLILPKMSGEEILDHIRGLDAALPVILSSGFDDTDEAEHLAHDPRTQFLKKPYGPNELLIAVRSALAVVSGPVA
jgi:DNA-binding NtrC family response regulator